MSLKIESSLKSDYGFTESDLERIRPKLQIAARNRIIKGDFERLRQKTSAGKAKKLISQKEQVSEKTVESIVYVD